MFGDGRFYHPDGKARQIVVEPNPPAALASPAFPLVLNTGRSRDQWHTMTRTGRSALLAAHAPEPTLSIHPKDAIRYGLSDNGLARVSGPRACLVLRVAVSAGQREGEVFAPIHWTDRVASGAVVGTVIDAAVDPFSGQPELKHAPVMVEGFAAGWHGVLLSRDSVELPRDIYWSKAAGKSHSVWRLAGEAAQDWPVLARDWLGDSGEWIEFLDPSRGHYRAARLVDGRLEGVLFIFRWATDFSPDWVAAAFGRAAIQGDERATLVAGAPPGGDRGGDKTVCACFQVGLNSIRTAIRDHRLASVAEIGAILKAGTNCGSCVPELRVILAEAADQVA